MNNYELCTTVGTPFYSSTEVSIIPIDDGNKVLLVPSQGAIFDTTVSVRESKSTYLFGPFDYNANQTKRSFADIYDYLTDDENLFSESETLETDVEQKEYEVDKDYIYELLESSNDSYPFEELMAALTVLLEEFPTVTFSTEKARATTPDDIILILENLVRNNIRLEEALQEINDFSSEEMNSLILAKDKFARYAHIVGIDLDSENAS